MNVRTTCAATAAVALLLALPACGDGRNAAAANPNLFTVQKRDLPITIKENAELQALRETVVRSELEGQATIIFLVPEGATVRQGDKLVELDSSELVDKRANQAITVAKAEASLAQAQKGMEILQKELVANRNTAESNLRIAQMDLEKFLGRPQAEGGVSLGKNADMVRRLRELVEAPAENESEPEGETPANLVSAVDPRKYASLVPKVVDLLKDDAGNSVLDREMGEMANKVLQQVDQIRLALADLKYQEAWYGHSQRLAGKQFITPTDLEKDRIEFQRRLSRVGLAWNDLDLLISYTLFKDRIKLRQDVENAKLDLERVLASNQAEETRAESELKSKQAEYDLAKGRLDNLERQIKNAVIFAPTPGLVVYARLDRDRRSSESVREGVNVRERQDLIILPDTTRMTAVVKVQEAVIDQVVIGQRALVTVEAQPDKVFTGRVTRVAPVADSNSGWMTSDRKVYTTIIELDGDNPDSSLRSRMAAAVTILVDELKDVLTVPLQAVRRDRSVNYVWKHTDQGPVAIPVEVGRHNAEQVAIQQGLAAGERIYLTPPTGASPPQFPQPEVPAPFLGTADTPGTGAPDSGSDGGGTEPENGGRRPGRGERDSPGRGTGREGAGSGAGPGGMGNLGPEMQQRMAAMRQTNEQLKAWLLAKYPERQAEIDDRRSMSTMLGEAAVQEALRAEQPDLSQQYDEMRRLMEQFRGGAGRPGGGERGQGGGERGQGGGERGNR